MYEYNATVLRVVDGDSLDVMIDQGFRQWRKERVRVLGVDCPETHGETKQAGLDAKQFTQTWCDSRGGLIRIKTVMDPNDSFGRVLADVYDRDDGSLLASALLSASHAVAYKR